MNTLQTSPSKPPPRIPSGSAPLPPQHSSKKQNNFPTNKLRPASKTAPTPLFPEPTLFFYFSLLHHPANETRRLRRASHRVSPLPPTRSNLSLPQPAPSARQRAGNRPRRPARPSHSPLPSATARGFCKVCGNIEPLELEILAIKSGLRTEKPWITNPGF